MATKLLNMYLSAGVMGWQWHDTEGKYSGLKLGVHDTVGKAKRAARHAGFKIVEGEQGVFAQKEMETS